MYTEFYKLSGMPFQLTPDHRFYFGSSNHTRAMAHLTYGLHQGEGFIVITGEVGAGRCGNLDRLPDIELAAPPAFLHSDFVSGIKTMPIRFTPTKPLASN